MSIITQLDPGQVVKGSYDEANKALRVIGAGGTLVPEKYDEIDLTYYTSGNGNGQIATVTYKFAGATIATLTLQYDINANLIQVVRS